MIKARETKKQIIDSFKKSTEMYSQKESTDQLINSKIIVNKNNHPKELEYWRKIFPTKEDNELEEYRIRWGNENYKFLKFKRL